MPPLAQDHTNDILAIIVAHPNISSTEINELLGKKVSTATLKRAIQKLSSNKLVSSNGKGRATKYHVGIAYELLRPIDMDEYYIKEIDERMIKSNYEFELINDKLKHISLFSEDEQTVLNGLQEKYLQNILALSDAEYKKELERLAIDLSWKSSQIEGNTYSLLETEKLLREKETAAGKTKDEAVMLLNHKDALDFIISDPSYLSPLKVSVIEDIHSILVKELDIDRNIRKNRVGISGTNYKPLDNEYQIKEALNEMCYLINDKQNVFEKALLILLLLSYIQPFNDGNKRTARIVSNAMLIADNYCPISFRTVDSIDYKKAMLIFYEQNNVSAFKKIFIDQFAFAVRTYF